MALNEIGRLSHVVVKHAREAFIDARHVEAQWKTLGFTAPPDIARAIDEYDRFLEALRSTGARIDLLPRDDGTTLDSIYVRDASVVSAHGVILCAMGKPARAREPAAQERAFQRLDDPPHVRGHINSPGKLEGGDVVWIDRRTVAVGQGYRTNAEGIRQLRELLGDGIEVVDVPLPHWRGTGDVMHLMSLISPVDRDLAVVYSPLMPVPFRDWLLDREYQLVEVPDEEFGTMGANVLALAPRTCLMLAGNPRTRAALERAGAEVTEYEGNEISVKGAGGPTCLTRPMTRSG
jgi:N-dimethylarginine dimethylaminohydrolase